MKCFNCNQAGYRANACTKPKRAPGSCFGCGKTDHQVRNCPTNRNSSNVNYIDDSTPPFYLPVTILDNSVTLQAVLDSGSPITLIQEQFTKEMTLETYCSQRQYTGAGGARVNIIGVARTSLLVKSFTVQTTVHVVANDTIGEPLLLGRDFIAQSKLYYSMSVEGIYIYIAIVILLEIKYLIFSILTLTRLTRLNLI